MNIRISKNGFLQRGRTKIQKLSVTLVMDDGATFRIHTSCESVKTANTIKRNVSNILAMLEANRTAGGDPDDVSIG